MKPNQSIIATAKAIKFIHTYPRWSDQDLADCLGYTKIMARRYRLNIANVYPIRQVRKENRIKGIDALYGLWEFHQDIRVENR